MMMKKTFLLCLFATICFSNTASADEGNWYLGTSAGQMRIDDISSYFDISNSKNAGLIVGYDFGNFLSIESEYTSSFNVDDYDMDISTLAVYSAFKLKMNDVVYLKARAGLVYEEVAFMGFKEDDTGLSAGAALGFDFNAGQIEIGYTFIEQDVDYIGVSLTFDL